MACHGGGRGGNGVSLLILIAIHIVGWFVSVFVTHKHRGGNNYANFGYRIAPCVRYVVASRKILIPLLRESVSPWSACFLLLLHKGFFSDIFAVSDFGMP